MELNMASNLEKSESYVLFELAGSTYGVASGNVHHIEMFEQVTLVPNANRAIDGVVFSRGQVIPALNLRTRFGFPQEPHTMRSRLVFVQVKQRLVGLIVDSAREFRNIPGEAIRPIQETLTGINGNYLKAVANVSEKLILLLDLESVLDVDQYEPAPSLSAEAQAGPLPVKSKVPKAK
jgi:purine-binding chemotaxis protein CheW